MGGLPSTGRGLASDALAGPAPVEDGLAVERDSPAKCSPVSVARAPVLLPRRADGLANGDVPVADPHDGGREAAGLRRLARTLLPARHARRDAHADLPPGGGARRRRGDHARGRHGTLDFLLKALFGQDRRTEFRTHYFPFTEPSIEAYVSCHVCDGTGCPVCRHSGWIEVGGAGMVDPALFEFVGTTRALHRLRVRLGPRAHRDAATRVPRPPRALARRPPLLEAVLMKAPLSWLRSTSPPTRRTWRSRRG